MAASDLDWELRTSHCMRRPRRRPPGATGRTLPGAAKRVATKWWLVDLLGVQGRGDLLEERLSCPGPSGSGGSIPGGRRGVNVDRVGMLDDHLVGGKFEVGAGRSFLFGHANSVLMPRLEMRHDPGYLIPRGGGQHRRGGAAGPLLPGAPAGHWSGAEFRHG